MDLPLNLYSRWKSISLYWTELCYCVIWLRIEIWSNVKVTVWGDVTLYTLLHKSTSLHQFDTCLTKLHGVTYWKTVTVNSIYYNDCVQNPLNISECASKIRSFGRLNVLIMCEGYCKLLLTCRRTMCVSAAACSVSVQVLSVDPVSHFHTVRYKITT
jgi:hypothetical protein